MAIVGKALIDVNGNVVNIVSYDTASSWTPPAGLTMVDSGPGAESGGTYANGVFTPAQFLSPFAGTNTRSLVTTGAGSSYQVSSVDKGFVLAITTGSIDYIVSLPSAGRLGDGFEVTVRKTDAGSTAPGAATSRVIVQDSTGATLAWLCSQGDVVRVRSDGTAWSVIYHALSPFRQVFNLSTSTGCVVPPLFTSVEAAVFAGGTGGKSGDRKATSAYRSGGTGGAAGYGNIRRLSAVDVLAIYGTGASVPVSIGAGGSGGASVSTDSTAGLLGSVGGVSSFGTLVDSTSNGVGSTQSYCGGGGGAAGYNTPIAQNSTTAVAGLNGSPPSDILGSGLIQAQSGYGSGGTTSGTPPTAGTAPSARPQIGGAGGGGGAYISGQAGQAGGNGGFPGGGGGGGSPSDNGFASGAGGNGGGGQVRATWNFGE